MWTLWLCEEVLAMFGLKTSGCQAHQKSQGGEALCCTGARTFLQFLCSVKVKIWRPNSSLAKSVLQSITSECKQPSPKQQETTTTTQQSNISTKIVVLSWISSTVSWGSTLRSPPPTISITKNMEGNDAKYNTTFTSARILRNHLKSVHCPSYMTQDGGSGRRRGCSSFTKSNICVIILF